MSRRTADKVIAEGQVYIDEKPATTGQEVTDGQTVSLNGRIVSPPTKTTTILLHKPVGYVCSRDGQGSKTIYDLLPKELHGLKPVGRLDKNSSGLLLLTNDGVLAHELTHPSRQKIKLYEVKLDNPLEPLHQQMISDYGIQLEDGASKFIVERIDNSTYRVTLHEGRNRQIRRTFAALGYTVTKLHRTNFGTYNLEGTPLSQYRYIDAYNT